MSKILVIEDNEDNLDMLSRRLERKGFDVIFATDGAQGLHMVRSEKPDLILLDLDIPVLDGWEVAHMLKRDPVTASVPIIALTAFAMPGDREKAIEAGCDDYASKPVDFPALLEKMRAKLGG